jgi:hypothetical protein
MAKKIKPIKPKTNAKTKPIIFTEEFVFNKANEMLEFINSAEGKNIIFITELCLKQGWSGQKWSEELKNYPENKQITETIKAIEETLELRLAKGLLAGKLNATGAIFTLKNKYKWKDKHDIEHANNPDNPISKGSSNIDLTLLSNEEIKLYIELEKKAKKDNE